MTGGRQERLRATGSTEFPVLPGTITSTVRGDGIPLWSKDSHNHPPSETAIPSSHPLLFYQRRWKYYHYFNDLCLFTSWISWWAIPSERSLGRFRNPHTIHGGKKLLGSQIEMSLLDWSGYDVILTLSMWTLYPYWGGCNYWVTLRTGVVLIWRNK